MPKKAAKKMAAQAEQAPPTVLLDKATTVGMVASQFYGLLRFVVQPGNMSHEQMRDQAIEEAVLLMIHVDMRVDAIEKAVADEIQAAVKRRESADAVSQADTEGAGEPVGAAPGDGGSNPDS